MWTLFIPCLYSQFQLQFLCVQIATDVQLADRAHMEQTIEDLEAALQSVCRIL